MMKNCNCHTPGVSAYVDGSPLTWKFWVGLTIGLVLLLSIASIPVFSQAHISPLMNDSGIVLSLNGDANSPIVQLNNSGIGIIDSAYVNSNLQVQHRGSFSWFCWINTVDNYPYGYILSDYSNDRINNVRLQMRGSTGQLKLMFKLGGATVNLITPPGLVINDGKDHFIGFVMDRENEVCILWVDGNQEAGYNLQDDYDELNNPTPFWIGTKNQYQLYTFKGIIDNVLIYNRALLDSEIYYLYGGTTMKTCGNPDGLRMDELIGWFQFSEGFGGRPENSITGELGLFTGHMIYWVDHRDREHIYH